MEDLFATTDNFLCLKQTKGRILGIDWGARHIGLSISDLTWTIASPFYILQHKNYAKTLQFLQETVAKERIIGVVLGWPLNMNGSIGPQCDLVSAFAKKLRYHLQIPLLKWDERLSSQAVHRTMILADLSRTRQKEVIDKMAASYLLQGCLDFLKNYKPSVMLNDIV